MACEAHLNDEGTRLEITVKDCEEVLDLSDATVKQILLKKPGGTLLTKSVSFVTDGTDGRVYYTTLAGDLDEKGLWKVQVHVELPTGTWNSSIENLYVHENLT